jgi:hypothetical protein
MQPVLAAALPLILSLFFFALPISVLIWVRKVRRRHRRSPLTTRLLRGPGETLRRELEQVMDDFNANMALLFAFPFIVCSIYLSQTYFGGAQESVFRWVLAGILTLGFVVYLLIKLLRLGRLRFDLQNGLEAEIAMGQELDQLMREGAIVFHDFPAEGFNIDHVVLTPDGMYAVETKGRMKPDRGGGKKDATVEFDGKVLSFPEWKDSKTLEQAARQARWLSKWISSAVGEPVAVKPVVALPGWWVELKGRGDVMVISGRQAGALLNGRQAAPFSGKLMKQIAHRLEERCRDVEPSQYGKQEKFGRPIRESS